MTPPEEPDRPRGPLLAVLGLVIASLSTMCGIGGGLFTAPLLHYVFKVPLKRSVATALCLVWCVSLSATISEALHPAGALHPRLVLALIAGALVGAQIGFQLAQRLPTHILKLVFCVVLLAVGSKMISMSGGGEALIDATFTPDIETYAVVAGIGLAAGILVPLLGVGGGLIVVPGLVLVMPEIGFLGARASSLGMAVVTSSRSLWLYHAKGAVDWRMGAWLGAGAAIGAVLGVQFAHDAGGEVGKVLLGVVLLLASARFGLDLSRAARDQGGSSDEPPAGGGQAQA